jgi:hypothetical protein
MRRRFPLRHQVGLDREFPIDGPADEKMVTWFVLDMSPIHDARRIYSDGLPRLRIDVVLQRRAAVVPDRRRGTRKNPAGGRSPPVAGR